MLLYWTKFWCNLYVKIMTLLTLSVKETMFISSERGLKPNDSDINRSDGVDRRGFDLNSICFVCFLKHVM